MTVTAYDIAQRFVGVHEIKGVQSNAHVLAMLRLDGDWPQGDDVPWCSAFVNYVAWLLRLPRSKSLAARSWLGVGRPVALADCRADSDVVILWRGDRDGPYGHVGFYASHSLDTVEILGGNQGDEVNVSRYPVERLLGCRRLD